MPAPPALTDAAAVPPQSLPSTLKSPQPEHEPFEPPADYEFEPELRGQTPRPIPKFERPGRLERRRKMAFLGLLTVGSQCLILAPLPIVQEIGLYFLPLGCLAWIGAGCLVLAAGSYGWQFVSRGPYRYIQDGLPIVARIVELIKAPTAVVKGESTHYAFHALIEFRDPRFGELRQIAVKSNPFSAGAQDEYTTTFQAGEYVTAIYLPRELEKTIRLYGFLDLNPEIGLVRRGKPARTGDLWKVPLLVAAAVGFFGMLCWNVYVFGRYHPVEFRYSQAVWPQVAGGIVLGGVMLAVLYLGRVRLTKIGVVVVALGSLLMGAGTMLCWCFTYNALGDDSPGQNQPVAIRNFWQKTHNGIFREYAIEYVFPGSERTYKLMTDPAHIAQFQVPLGVAEVHSGRLGWKWVKSIRPVGVADLLRE